MKLYATTTSERASKGQGGEYLDIELKNELKLVFATIKVRGQEVEIWYDCHTTVHAYKDSAWGKDLPAYDRLIKGNKQKGNVYCEQCLKATLGCSELRKHCANCRQ